MTAESIYTDVVTLDKVSFKRWYRYIETIRRMAGWSNGNTFAKFYYRPVNDDGLYARKVVFTD